MVLKLIKGNNARTLLVFNALIFLAVFSAPLWVTTSAAWLFGTLFAYFCMICLGVSITYHRSLTHRAVKFHPAVEMLFCTFASLSGTGSPVMWVLTHRQHHKFSDKLGDPHPPKSVWKTFLGAYPRVSALGIKDIIRNRYYAFIHRYYFGLIGSVFIAVSFISLEALFFVLVLPIFISILVSNTLNWYGHTKGAIGYRNFNLADNSQNNALCGLLIFGEGWHNNHHRFPGSARFGLTKWEIDVSYGVIKVLEFLGLASTVKVSSWSKT